LKLACWASKNSKKSIGEHAKAAHATLVGFLFFLLGGAGVSKRNAERDSWLTFGTA
jgi:hypothetical protein